MNLIPFLLAVLIILNVSFGFALIFLERKDPAATWAWLMVLTLLPFFGFLLYLLFGQNLQRQKIFDTKTIDDIILYKKSLDQIKELKDCKELDLCRYDSFYQDFIQMHLLSSHSVYTENNHVDIIIDGEEKFKKLMDDIENAKDHIHLLYYIIKNDDLSGRLMKALTKKAKEGVEVRLLFDCLGSRKLPKDWILDFEDVGGKFATFFPARIPIISLRINYRNHRKIVVIDGKIGYVGGFNIGDEYLGLDKKFGYWRDNHLRIQGNAVQSMQMRFASDWNHSSPDTMNYEKRFYPTMSVKSDTGIQIVSSGPDSEEMHIKNGYLKMIMSARKSIYIQTPYFVPDQSFLECLKIAAMSGVDVNIMIPNKPDHIFIYWASYSYIGDLLKSGVKAYTYEGGFLHAKTLVIDEEISSVGTANMDIRSFKLNFEINAFIYDKTVASSLTYFFKEDLKKSKEMTQERYDSRTTIIKIKESIARLLSPIL